VRLCYELQALQKTEPFWLSENDGALILGVTRPTIGKWLCMLEADGVIKKTEKHTAIKAARYKFIAKYGK
jgi:predicted transcriptional regulator